MAEFNNGSLKGGFGFQDQGTRKTTNPDGTVSTVSYSALRTANFEIGAV